MVQCAKCKASGLKFRNMISAILDGKSELVCKKCAQEMLGVQEPFLYVKKLSR